MSTCVNRSGQISPLILSLLTVWSLPCHLMVLCSGFSRKIFWVWVDFQPKSCQDIGGKEGTDHYQEEMRHGEPNCRS